ncbi:MAG: stage III sporulation protein AE [Acetobacter sp.]|nr:stage III sporulation protein AE [Bacteroides sp.]MCM1340597.1 stage III sporulation protein AE [Acetobacter sp.]MCM1433337.1 stage III sporulation protein AE [Clostridiales bacterium]
MKRFLISLLMILIIPSAVFAQDNDYQSYVESFDLSAFEELDDNTKNFLEELGISDFDYDKLSSISIADVFKYIFQVAVGKAQGPIKAGLTMLCFIIISLFYKSFSSEVNKSDISSFFSTVTTLIISIFLVVKLTDCIGLCSSTIKLCSNFAFAFFPVFCLITASAGGTLTSFSVNTQLLILAQGINYIAELLFVPIINCFLALGICSSLRQELNLNGIMQFLKNIIAKGISIISAIFVSILTVKTAVASRADALGLRSIRFAINTVVPVIGSSISEGLLSIQSYSGLIKTSVGLVGIIAVACIFLPSIIEICIWRFVLYLARMSANVFNDDSSSKAVSCFEDVLLIINVILILCMVTTIISIGILVAAKTGM